VHIEADRCTERSPRCVFIASGVLDNIELGLELLSIYDEWPWTLRQLDQLFLPMVARLSVLSSVTQSPGGTDDADVAVARVMLGIIGNALTD